MIIRISGPAAAKLSRIELRREPDTDATRYLRDGNVTSSERQEGEPPAWSDLPPHGACDGEHIWIRQDFPWGGGYSEKFHFVMLASAAGASYRTEKTEAGPAIILDKPAGGAVTVYYGNSAQALSNARVLGFYANSLLVFDTPESVTGVGSADSMPRAEVSRRMDFEFHERIDF